MRWWEDFDQWDDVALQSVAGVVDVEAGYAVQLKESLEIAKFQTHLNKIKLKRIEILRVNQRQQANYQLIIKWPRVSCLCYPVGFVDTSLFIDYLSGASRYRCNCHSIQLNGAACRCQHLSIIHIKRLWPPTTIAISISITINQHIDNIVTNIYNLII